MTSALLSPRKVALALLPAGSFALLLAGLADLDLCQTLFLRTTYYLHLALVLSWVALLVQRVRAVNVRDWLRSHGPGLVVALAVTLVVGTAVEPALRVLSDEANLVGISKNLYATKSPTFTISGKSYYESYFDVDVVIDQRPTLFPFFVTLVHACFGYSYENAFHFNLMVLPLFILAVYRLAKDLAGPSVGVVASLLTVSHPALLLAVRSGGFDFFATFLSVLVLGSLWRFLRTRKADDLALLWIHLCLFSSVRYESALIAAPVVLFLAAFGLVKRAHLKTHALLFAASPWFLLPRVWLSLLRGNVPRQEPGAVTFSAQNFLDNTHEYFLPLLDPLGHYPAHAAVVLALGLGACGRWLWLRPDRGTSSDPAPMHSKFALAVMGWTLAQAFIVFSYVWGRAQYPSAARLVLPLDVFFSFMAAWLLARSFRSRGPLVVVLVSVGIFLTQIPSASRPSWMSKLTETRENAEVWKFFRRLGKERILVVSTRPVHFTIMNYGSMTFDSARNDPYLFTALDRRLFEDVYLVQHIQLSTGKPLPGYDFWSERRLTTAHEFQNEADVLIRIARVERAPLLLSESP